MDIYRDNLRQRIDQTVPSDYYNSCATPPAVASYYSSLSPASSTGCGSVEASSVGMYDSMRNDSLYASSPYSHNDLTYNQMAAHHTWMPGMSALCDKERQSVIVGQPPAGPPPKRKGGRKPKDDPNLPPIELEKRRLRRARNKEAAAKCRERRLNHTSTLIKQIEQLEQQQKDYEEEIGKLKKTVSDCESTLNTHEPNCSINTSLPAPSTLVNSQSNRRKQTTPRLKLDTTCSESHRKMSSSSSSDLQSPSIVQ